MYTLNLAYPERGTVKFRKLSFPDGQQDIVIEGGYPQSRILGDEFHVVSRMNSFQDLELIACARKAASALGVFDEFYLKVPYLLGARSDRQFVEGGTAYLRDVIAPFINSLDFHGISILDPHSDVVEAVIDKYWPVELLVPFPQWVADELADGGESNYLIVSPDAGSLKKIYQIAKDIGYDDDIIIAHKHREIATGKILSTDVPLRDEHGHKAFVIFDDICDGGRTFIEIAKVIRKHWSDSKIYLAVTHGIFSQGFVELGQYFTHIFTTNSVRDIAAEWAVKPDSNFMPMQELVTQLDVL